jgi:hypothetical protein
MAAGLQILSEGQHVAVMLPEIPQHLLDFVALFSKAQHQA